MPVIAWVAERMGATCARAGGMAPARCSAAALRRVSECTPAGLIGDIYCFPATRGVDLAAAFDKKRGANPEPCE